MTSTDNHQPAPPSKCEWDCFVSHSKRVDSSEDRAVWVADVCDETGLKAFFDRSHLTEITVEALRKAVAASKMVVTVLGDPSIAHDPSICRPVHV